MATFRLHLSNIAFPKVTFRSVERCCYFPNSGAMSAIRKPTSASDRRANGDRESAASPTIAYIFPLRQ